MIDKLNIQIQISLMIGNLYLAGLITYNFIKIIITIKSAAILARQMKTFDNITQVMTNDTNKQTNNRNYMWLVSEMACETKRSK